MKQIIRLTENDLVRIVKRVINENKQNYMLNEQQTYTVKTDEQVLDNVKMGKSNLKIFKGLTFTKSGNNMVSSNTNIQFVYGIGNSVVDGPEYNAGLHVAANMGGAITFNVRKKYKGQVTYSCSSRKFTTTVSGNNQYEDENNILSKNLDKVCKGVSSVNKPNQLKPGTPTKQGLSSKAKINTTNDGGYDYKLENGKYYYSEKGKNSWIEAEGDGLAAIKRIVKF
jgi:hypothetical protein